MASWCLIKEQADKFKAGLRSGEINPEKLSTMTSEERNAFLSKYVGKENATQVNALFESKLLLKNQKAGMITWAKKVANLKPEVRRDLVSQIERLEKVLNPAEEKQFLKDLASTRLGADVTHEEAQAIFELSKKVSDTRQVWTDKFEKDPNLKWLSDEDRLAYGRAKVALGNYVGDLKAQAGRLSISERINPKNYIKDASDAAGIAKSLKASLDNSAIFRQGWKTLWTHPEIWQKNARQSFVHIWKTLGGQKVMDEIAADIVSRPNYERMRTAKLAVSTIEEAFPSTLPEKIPFLGRFYKASETAYTGFIYKQRADIFDAYLRIAEKSGVDIDSKKELQAIGKLVNSLTGRGHLGVAEPAANIVNNIFFSPRFIKSQIDTLVHPFTGAGGSNFVRKQASWNLLRIVLGTAAVLTIAKAVNPKSVDEDPRSSDFGKIKVGNTRFDVTGGSSALFVLASRLATGMSKSSTTGRVTELNSGKFGSQTKLDVIYSFFENKLSPATSVIRDVLKGQDFKGNTPTVTGELSNLLVPIPITNYQELSQDPNAANIVLSLIADGLGIGTNTYGQSKADWKKETSKEIQQFKDKVDSKDFESANKEFNTQYDEWFKSTATSDDFLQLSEDGKQKLINDAKDKIKTKIFSNYGFKYKKPKVDFQDASEKSAIKQLLP